MSLKWKYYSSCSTSNLSRKALTSLSFLSQPDVYLSMFCNICKSNLKKSVPFLSNTNTDVRPTETCFSFCFWGEGIWYQQSPKSQKYLSKTLRKQNYVWEILEISAAELHSCARKLWMTLQFRYFSSFWETNTLSEEQITCYSYSYALLCTAVGKGSANHICVSDVAAQLSLHSV